MKLPMNQFEETMSKAADMLVKLQDENAQMRSALDLALEYWSHRLQRYKNRSPAWVVAARAALSAKDHS